MVPEVNKTFEVKRDFLSEKTGNYFIETKYGDKLSGISLSKADFYVFVGDLDILIIPTAVLKELIAEIGEFTYEARGTDRSRTGKLIRKYKVKSHLLCKTILRRTPTQK
jgi:hypothetical protein